MLCCVVYCHHKGKERKGKVDLELEVNFNFQGE